MQEDIIMVLKRQEKSMKRHASRDDTESDTGPGRSKWLRVSDLEVQTPACSASSTVQQLLTTAMSAGWFWGKVCMQLCNSTILLS